MVGAYERAGYEQDHYGWAKEKAKFAAYKEEAQNVSHMRNDTYTRLFTNWSTCTSQFVN